MTDSEERALVTELEKLQSEYGSYTMTHDGNDTPGTDFFQHIIDRYSPKPRYCEKMTGAIRDGNVTINSQGKYIAYEEELLRCPVCPPGQDCLKPQ